jgi:formylglycine-generating enzyme required for sulfatase activity/predicted Ser/Thr protein kinase
MSSLDPGKKNSTHWALAQRIDAVCDRFEDSWKSGMRPDLDEYLAEFPESERFPLFRELVKLDLACRADRGEVPCEADYAARFPAWDVAVHAAFQQARARNCAASTPDSSGTSADTGGYRSPGDQAASGSFARSTPTPETIGRYRVLGRLGGGGQADVYRAAHPSLSVEVVLKLSRNPARHGDRDRLMAEGRLLAELDHPNLAKIYDLDLFEGRPYLVLEYVRGLNLRQHVAQHPVRPVEAASLVASLAEAVGAAHARGAIHRDIKPENIVIDDRGRPKLIDFGLAQIRDAWLQEYGWPGEIAGTAAYMAPEQARSDQAAIGVRSDVFGLGAVLFFLLAGIGPFEDATLDASLQRARQCQFDAALLQSRRVPRRLASVCLKALEKDASLRYASANDFARDLQDFARSARRRRTTLMGRVCLVLLLAVSATAAILGMARGRVHHEANAGARAGGDERLPGPARVRQSAADDDKPATTLQAAWTNSIGMKLAIIPPGTFRMGSADEIPHAPPGGKPGNFHAGEPYSYQPGGRVRQVKDYPRHEVRITKPFYIGVYEVTQREWQLVMGDEPAAKYKRGLQYPVDSVFDWQAIKFCKRLTLREKRIYRLPTEAEWEYACRAGTTTNYAFGDSVSPRQANYAAADPKTPKKSQGGPRPVGSFPPNGYGLCDMHGNVAEWVADFYAEYGPQSVIDPKGPFIDFSKLPGKFALDYYRVARGGSWTDPAGGLTSYRRQPMHGSALGIVIGRQGFRVVCDPNLDYETAIGNYDLLHQRTDSLMQDMTP